MVCRQRRVNKILFGAEILFRGLNRRMSQQQLDLPKLTARRSAQFRACPSKVVRRNTGNADCRRVLAEHLPNHFLAQALARDSVGAVHGAENIAVRYTQSAFPVLRRAAASLRVPEFSPGLEETGGEVRLSRR